MAGSDSGIPPWYVKCLFRRSAVADSSAILRFHPTASRRGKILRPERAEYNLYASDTPLMADRIPERNGSSSYERGCDPVQGHPRSQGISPPQEPPGRLGVPERRRGGERRATADRDQRGERGGRDRRLPSPRRLPRRLQLRLRGERQDHPQDGPP